VLMTVIVPLAPVLGNAEGAVESAPTHQTDPGVENLGKKVLTGALFIAGATYARAKAPPMIMRMKIESTAAFNDSNQPFFGYMACGVRIQNFYLRGLAPLCGLSMIKLCGVFLRSAYRHAQYISETPSGESMKPLRKSDE